MSQVYTFPIGALVLHKGAVCRVLASTPNFSKGLGYMGVPDGTEFNPTLTVEVLRTAAGQVPKTKTIRRACSGSMESVEDEIARLRARLAVLEEVSNAPDP